MLRRATEAVVEIDVAARGVDVVAPQQAGDAAAGPDAFGAPAELASFGLGLLVFGDRLGGFLLLGPGLIGGLLVALGLLGLLCSACPVGGLGWSSANAGRADSTKTPPARKAAAGPKVRRSMNMHPTRGEDIFGVKALNLGSPTANSTFNTSQAHKPEQSVQSRRKKLLFVASPSPKFTMLRSLLSSRSSPALSWRSGIASVARLSCRPRLWPTAAS